MHIDGWLNMKKKMLSDIEISSFCIEIAMLLKAGMPLEDGLFMMMEEEKSAEGKLFLKQIYESVSEGLSFHSVLMDSGAFPEYVVNMVLIGEKTGTLENVLHELNLYYESKDELVSNLKAAVIYPFIMLIMMTIILLILALKVLPMFSQIYDELGSGIPASVLMVTQIGRASSLILAGLLLIAIVIIIGTAIYKKINPQKDISSFKNIIFRRTKMGMAVAKARFASVISLAFASGLEIDYAMDLSLELIDYPDMKNKIKECKSKLDSGVSFSEALQQSEIFDGMNAGLVNTGFKTGNIEEMMKFVAGRYETDAEKKIGETVAVIEPAIVITMSVLVGMILLVVMLPLLGIMSTMG